MMKNISLATFNFRHLTWKKTDCEIEKKKEGLIKNKIETIQEVLSNKKSVNHLLEQTLPDLGPTFKRLFPD